MVDITSPLRGLGKYSRLATSTSVNDCYLFTMPAICTRSRNDGIKAISPGISGGTRHMVGPSLKKQLILGQVNILIYSFFLFFGQKVDPFKLEDIEILDTYMNGRWTKCNLTTWVPSCFICNVGILKNTFIKSYLKSTTPPYCTVSLNMIIIWGVIYWWVHGEMY